MERYLLKFYGVLMLVALPFLSFANGSKASVEDVMMLMRKVKKWSIYSYDINMSIIFPDKTKEVYSGKISIDLPNKCLFEQSQLSTTLITRDWFYRASHTDKSVKIVSLGSYFKKQGNRQEIDRFFSESAMRVTPDSILIRLGSVVDYKIDKGVVQVKMKFKPGIGIDRFEFVYDMSKDRMITVFVSTLNGVNGGIITQEFTCRNFKKTTPSGRFNPAPYFLFRNGKIELVQYKNYKLSKEL